MNTLEASALIETYLSTNWTATKLAFENVEARDWSATGTPYLSEGTDPYVSIYKQFASSETIVINKRYRRYYGFLHTLIHTKEGVGARIAETHASNMQNLLEGTTINTDTDCLRFWDMVQETRYWTDGGWFVIDLSFRFSFEKFSSPAP